MSEQQVRETLDGYVEALRARGDFRRFFADDVDVEIQWSDQHMRGAEATEQAIRYLHEVAFDADIQVRTVLASEDCAAIEAVFVGTHIAEFAGVPATGREVRVPYSVFYDIGGGSIRALRIYLPMSEVMAQIGAGSVAAAR
jgi:steroid delta-isomerase-like uncharacterized protein